ncbi:MAG: hypothetical protein C0417_13340 [Chlorobiaceae bacterium]|nr:hypothetical protein [Chlorobiaceae bacterium]
MQITFFGDQPPTALIELRPGCVCPQCRVASRFTLVTNVKSDILGPDKIKQFIASYSCDNCLAPLPIQWTITGWNGNRPIVTSPKVVSSIKELFEFEHVPESVKTEIEEALDCLSVSAFNGFAAVCRRATQAICVNIGADATTKIKTQIEDMIKTSGLGDEWKELAYQIMLSGHDGSHPHLPDVTSERADVLLSLLKDLTYQLYTRPGKIKQAALLRQSAINSSKTKT